MKLWKSLPRQFEGSVNLAFLSCGISFSVGLASFVLHPVSLLTASLFLFILICWTLNSSSAQIHMGHGVALHSYIIFPLLLQQEYYYKQKYWTDTVSHLQIRKTVNEAASNYDHKTESFFKIQESRKWMINHLLWAPVKVVYYKWKMFIVGINSKILTVGIKVIK